MNSQTWLRLWARIRRFFHWIYMPNPEASCGPVNVTFLVPYHPTGYFLACSCGKVFYNTTGLADCRMFGLLKEQGILKE